ncbi:MAG: Uma2 family endonuclease [Bryobacteraceae bacterium]
MSTKTLMTVDEFARLDFPETEVYELVEGELVRLASGTPRHALVRDRLGAIVLGYFAKNPIGLILAEIDCRVAEYTVRMPDLSIFLAENWRNLDLDKIPVPFAPDIAVEVLSPSEGAIDCNRKIRDYVTAGTREVWVLDIPNGEIFVHSLAAIRLLRETDTLDTPLLPGFSVRVTEILRAPGVASPIHP